MKKFIIMLSLLSRLVGCAAMPEHEPCTVICVAISEYEGVCWPKDDPEDKSEYYCMTPCVDTTEDVCPMD